ncbi:hypothetical protein MTQ01_04835 [Streptomyces sp. XM4193]|uniref:pyridoxamine 5'-phosphate oxidase family protein n=1 Tax=Streptomyces sp. XM4193 TaxID=2929782 RepID=UPI001FF85965|nr:pyridoxamine 5'-phosphate oxidase family protein [Streptomyces sp. XM4193]MCK1795343.1 hypothetical protein [Streptomyces sp. XM4193]
MTTPTTGLAMYARKSRVRLTTYQRDGQPVGTAQAIAVEGDRAYVRASARSKKIEHLHRYPEVEITPATLGGTPAGAPMKARARLLEGLDARYAARRLAMRHPFMHGLVLPVGSALTFDSAEYYELRLIGE